MADLRTVFQAAQTYTILSRVENIEQVFILGSLPKEKFYADILALEELKRLEKVSVNKDPPIWEKEHTWSLKICSFNIRSLKEHITDLRSDPIVKLSDIICLSETWLKNEDIIEELKLNSYQLHLNSAGHGKGLAIYFQAEKFKHSTDIKQPNFQVTKMTSPSLDVISVYRSSGGSQSEMLDTIKTLLSPEKSTMICGDFNICLQEKKNKGFLEAFEQLGFEEMVKQATHFKGGHIDHVYFFSPHKQHCLEAMLYSPYYPTKDHDAICSTVRPIIQ